MSTRRWTWSISLALATSLTALTGAQSSTAYQLPSPSTGDQAAAPFDETPDLWFVELASPPTADGTSLAQVQKEKADFRAAAARAGLQYAEQYAFDTLWNGLSVRIATSAVSTLARIPGVKAIYPVLTATYQQDSSSINPGLFTAVTMTGADIVRNTLGYTGAGVKVAVMDSGIDYSHPDLGGCFGPGCRVTKGYDFVGDAFDNGAHPTPVPDPDPMDCNGHGTHVAGIVGAKAAAPGGVTGVAPGATLFAYRVFGCSGPSRVDILLAAMERALADGADVLNMSIVSGGGWAEYPDAAAATRLVDKGVSVVASAGNDGGLGLYYAAAPSVGTKVISVASFENIAVRMPYFTITPDGLHVPYLPGVANAGTAPPPAPPDSGTYPMARTGTSTTTNDACAALPAGSLGGKVALIRRGTCSFAIKAENAQHAGAVGVVLYNNTTGILAPNMVTTAISIPVVMITSADGATIDSRLSSSPVDMTWTGLMDSVPQPTGGLISGFSSYGVTPELDLKPDIGAPGGSIYSTYPIALGSYATANGTSMSSPHVAGAVALLLQAAPQTPANAVRSILQNASEPHTWWGNPTLGLLDNVHRQGAGMLRIDRAILATTTVQPGKLALGESSAGPSTRTLTIHNNSGETVVYTMSHAPALATGPNTFSPSFFNGPASVTFSTPTVSVPAHGRVSVDVTITAEATLPDRSLYGGYIVVTPQGGGEAARVPYSGFKGDYQSIPVLVPTTNGFPWLAKRVGTSLVNQPGGASYTLAAGDVPFIVVHIDHPARLLRMEVQDANTGKDWHRALEISYLRRNAAATSFFVYSWDGVTSAGNNTYNVPNGQYRIVLTVLKALGDPNNPSDVETWVSPVITIARP